MTKENSKIFDNEKSTMSTYKNVGDIDDSYTTANLPSAEDNNEEINNNIDVDLDKNEYTNSEDITAHIPTTLDDIDDKTSVSYEERISNAMNNNISEPCKRNNDTDKKINNYSLFFIIPLLFATIIFSYLNRNGIKYNFVFLLLSFAMISLAMTALLRYKNNIKCNCKVCATQAKTLKSTALIWFILAGIIMLVYIVFLFIS